jgi:signal transduction protein with GAF and PtsI domain
MISLKKCDEVLNKNERKFTNEQVEKIRDFLYQIADIITQSNQLIHEESGGEKSDFI